jgi:chromosome segregation ATPase
MSTTEEQLKRIQDKLQQLLKQQASVRKENEKLKEELGMAREKLSLQQLYLDELRQQVSILKLNAGGMNDRDKKEIEKKINSYLKEIDRCIALLGE